MGVLAVLVAVVLGFALPGALLLRACGLPIRRFWPGAFLASAVLLYQAVFCLQLLSIPLRFATVAAVLAIVTAGLGVWVWRSRRTDDAGAASTEHHADAAPRAAIAEPAWTGLRKLLVTVAAVLTLLLLYRVAMAPLSGYDTQFRWEYLSVSMLEHGHFDFYPPRRAEDFRVYIYPDSTPPIVQTAYFWLYAAWGERATGLAAVFVGLQVLGVLWLVYAIAAHHAGSREAGAFAVILALASRVLIDGMAMGQETGMTTLAILAIYYLVATASERHRTGAVVATAFAAAACALAREYGWVGMLFAVIAMWMHGYGRRRVALLVGLTLLLAMPWYLRTWALTGNPMYPLDVMGLFPTNVAHRVSIELNAARMAPAIEKVAIVVIYLGLYSLLPIAVGVLGLRGMWRDHRALLIGAALVLAAWLKSVPYTAGVHYSTRVLSPVIATLVIAAAIWFWRASAAGTRRRTLGKVIAAIAVVPAVIFCTIYPHKPYEHAPADWPTLATTTYRIESQWGMLHHFRDVMNANLTDPEEVRVIVDGTEIGVVLQRAGYDVVPIFSPEVAFIFDPGLDAAEVRRRLVERDIRLVLHTFEDPWLFATPFYQSKDTWHQMYRLEYLELHALAELPTRKVAPDPDASRADDGATR